MLNILVVYSCRTFPLRSTSWNHLYFLQKYSGHRCFYVNIAVQGLPRYLWKVPFDLIVFDTLFFSRWKRTAFLRRVEQARALRQLDAVRIALPQDEFISADILSGSINELGIDVVFSVAPPSEWPKIYPTVDPCQVAFYQVLTGYLDDEVVANISALERQPRKRTIDIGYRVAGRPYLWFGRHGYLKQRIAEVFQAKAPPKGLAIDISTRDEDAILGDGWYEFLLRCKYTIGAEGGTSILDWDGSIHEETSNYVARHPQATFEEVEAACFPNRDGTFQLFAMGPRHLEACATKTCQVLTTGNYNGVLEPGKHYIELKKDFSNIDQVLELMAEDRLRAEITERAYQDIVASGKYSYKRFVEFILECSLPGATSAPRL